MSQRQQRRERQHTAVRDEIKTMARMHMARDGAAALSLRAVASDLGLSSAAIYYYYPNRDALITDLIVDAFGALGAALRAADPRDSDIALRLEAVMNAYRTWAVAHAAEYSLLFGTPIPGYVGPTELTTPAAREAFIPMFELFAYAHQHQRLQLDLSDTPTTLIDFMTTWLAETGQALPVPVMFATIHTWAHGHGLISLELDHHLHPLVGDPAILFSYEVKRLLRQFGLQPG